MHDVWQQSNAVLAPPPTLSVCEWAEANFRLSAEDSSEPGSYSADRAPFQRDVMNAVGDPRIAEVVFMKSAQVGATTIVKAVIGYFIDQDPAPLLCVNPTVAMAETFSKDRLGPMIRDTPVLTHKVADPKSRDGGNTTLHKRFKGGHVTLAGSNSPASLASRPCRVILLDEVDRYPASAGTEGDPVNLARKRAQAFLNRVIFQCSTPTDKGVSRIEKSFEQSDQRFFYVPCQHCGTYQRLTWASVQWPEDEPEKAAIRCEECGALWSEGERLRSIMAGEYRATRPFRGVAGFHISELYSPFSTPAAMAREFLLAKRGGRETLKTWVNTALGEAFEEQGDTISEQPLLDRREEWGDKIPNAVGVLTMGVDVQADRLELELVGWSADGEQESWSIAYEILPGEPAFGDVWADLKALINASYTRADGKRLAVALTCIDSGYLPKRVYRFCGEMGAHVIPVKGVTGIRPVVESGRQRLERLLKRKRDGVKPELVGVDEARFILHSRLRLKQPGPGYCHFPTERTREYFAQLTAHKLITKYKKGQPFKEWETMRARDEAADCRNYAFAALLLHLELTGKARPGTRRRRRPPALPRGVGLGR